MDTVSPQRVTELSRLLHKTRNEQEENPTANFGQKHTVKMQITHSAPGDLPVSISREAARFCARRLDKILHVYFDFRACVNVNGSKVCASVCLITNKNRPTERHRRHDAHNLKRMIEYKVRSIYIVNIFQHKSYRALGIYDRFFLCARDLCLFRIIADSRRRKKMPTVIVGQRRQAGLDARSFRENSFHLATHSSEKQLRRHRQAVVASGQVSE